MLQAFKIWDGQTTDPYLVIATDVVDAMNVLVAQEIIANHYSIRRAEHIGPAARLHQLEGDERTGRWYRAGRSGGSRLASGVSGRRLDG